MNRTVEEYIADGYPREFAEYFFKGRRKMKNVIPRKDYTLLLTFDNGEQRILDLSAKIAEAECFAPLRDWAVFSRASLDKAHNLYWDIDPNIDSDEVWENRITYCPDCCYVRSTPVADNHDEGNFFTLLITVLKEQRKKKGITQRDLARLTGIRQPSIAKIESGKIAPNIDTINKLLRPLGRKLTITSLEEDREH